MDRVLGKLQCWCYDINLMKIGNLVADARLKRFNRQFDKSLNRELKESYRITDALVKTDRKKKANE